eukprot:TRINITY_DN15801_c0_g1_i1.p1 TRINITY_DN15801_c0_g1~~TRINITY_DN15801_c0_g1_i1.p1  ORF type:complete len:234 (-),score=54.72 TRINITY_DN15801_c0_g1_i1:230-931(-)
MTETTSLWVFGYGSLVWKPGFQHGQTAIGYVEGLSRRFWQGNETHRGVPGAPGRVATLVDEKEGITHGIAMELKGQEALDYLNNREMTLGGYESRITTFHPTEKEMNPFPVLVFIATPKSKHWLGYASSKVLAKQVVNASGPSGHNVEYVIKLAQWLRKTFPEVEDDHLYNLEKEIYVEISINNLCLTMLMGSSETESCEVSAPAPTAAAHVEAKTTSYSSTLPTKCLRCVKV